MIRIKLESSALNWSKNGFFNFIRICGMKPEARRSKFELARYCTGWGHFSRREGQKTATLGYCYHQYDPWGPCRKDGCMKNIVCTKWFPKPFQKKTLLDKDRSYPIYRRRSPQDGGIVVKRKRGKLTTDGWYPTIPISPNGTNARLK